MIRKHSALVGTALSTVALAALLAGCTGTSSASAQASTSSMPAATASAPASFSSMASDAPASMQTTTIQASQVEGAVLDGSEMFTDRDLEQTADTSDAQQIALTSGQDVTITEEGVYVVTGTATDATIYVEADDTAKVQLVLSGVSVTNETTPAIYVKSADKVFVTLEGSNKLTVTGTFEADGDTNVDAVIFSKDDLTLNGTGSLTIESTGNGITSKDDLKVTGGTYNITATGHCLDSNDSVRIADGTFTLNGSGDGIHADNDEDPELGYVYIAGGTFDISVDSDGIRGTSVTQVDGGTFTIDAGECLEGTYLQINDGYFALTSNDDAINASTKSTAYTPTVDIKGGTIDITMAAGDTDAIDSNGNLYISGGTINISAQSAFDVDGQISKTGGTVYVNGEEVTEITNSMMMGGGMGGDMGAQGGMQGGSMGSQGSMGPQGGSMGGPQGGMR